MEHQPTMANAQGAMKTAGTKVPHTAQSRILPGVTATWMLDHMHQALGNRSVGRWLQSNMSVSAPGDAYEREAERVADLVTSAPEPRVHRKCARCAGGSVPCADCEREATAQTKPAATTSAAQASESVGLFGGAPLAEDVRSFFELKMGHDFGGVRIHADAEAARSAASLSARAYTNGANIVFAAGEYQPGTTAGNHLLAHELTHVVQQAGASGRATPPAIQRFTTAEHLDIGNAAYATAAQDFSGPAFKNSSLYRTLRDGSRLPTGKQVKAYGDIVADGDFFQTFEDLIRESGERPGRVGMAVLATRNVHHFTPNNIREWIPQHGFAVDQMLFAHDQLKFVRDWLDGIDPLLEGARAAILRDDDARAERLMKEYRRQFEPQKDRMSTIAQSAHRLAQQALARNAFAEHFLTDAFSAGHIVTPRQEILQQAGVRLDQMPTAASLVRSALLGTTWGELGEVRAQARSLAWHDLDNFYGVEVRNNDPGFAPWIACGDGCSTRTADTHWAATRASVIRATAESIKDLWRAGLIGVRTPDFRSVLDLVPRPTFNNYPAWGALDWQNQLRYIRGDNAPNIPGEKLDTFAIELHPIEHCAQPDIGCYDPFVLTAKDWIRQYSFDRWVRPWSNWIQANASTRYTF